MHRIVALKLLLIGFLISLVAGFSSDLLSAAESEEQIADESWLEDAWLDDDREFRSLDVNEGELTFIAPVTARTTLHSDTVLSISESSLVTGWVALRQCYFNINPVDATDIVYRYKQIRNLKITSSDNIGQVQTDKQANELFIHLHNITAGASLCINADINVIEKEGGDIYVINNGPYHLRFLDGYYPYHVTLSINYPAELIKFRQISPSAQPLFNVTTASGNLSIDSWFEGVLTIRLEFEKMKLERQKN